MRTILLVSVLVLTLLGPPAAAAVGAVAEPGFPEQMFREK